MKYLSLILGLTLILASCTYTSTMTKFPEVRDDDALSRDFDKLVKSDGMNLNGSETNQNGSVTSEVTIEVYNPQDLPKGVMQKQPIARKIAKLVRKNLANKSEFNQYKVAFIYQNGMQTNSEFLTFPAKELK